MAQQAKKKVKEGPKKKRSASRADVLIGKRLRGLRALHHVSQEELAGKVKLTYQQIQKYESGQNKISASMLKNLADIFKVTPNFFYGLEDTKHIKKLFNLEDEEAIKVAESWQDLPTKELRTALFQIIVTINRTWNEGRNPKTRHTH